LGKSDDAIRVYNEIEGSIGITEEVSLQKQRIFMVVNKPEKAVSEVESLIEAFPDESVRYYSMLAEIYMQQNKPDIAAGFYRKIIELDPGNPYVHISLSDYYRKKGDPGKSFEELKAGFANPALDVDTKIRVMMTYYNVDEIYGSKKDQVSELTAVLLKAHPGDPKALSLNGDMLLNNEKFSEAREAFRQVLASDSSSYSVWESLLQADAALLDWNALAYESSRAMDLFPFQPVPYFFNGLALLQLKNPADAIKTLKSGSKLVTGNEQLLVQFYSNLGDAYNQVKEYSMSDEYYEKVLKMDPENSYVLNNYAYYLSLRGENLDKALKMARLSVSKDSLNPANIDTYGWVLYKLGRYEEAKTWVGKAISKSSKVDADLMEHYGDILFKLGKKEEALEYWEKARVAGGNSEILQRKIREQKIVE
jgi:tetratricopeptide (TPR) repeat protein